MTYRLTLPSKFGALVALACLVTSCGDNADGAAETEEASLGRDPSVLVETAGTLILDSVRGRSREEAVNETGDQDNPFYINFADFYDPLGVTDGYVFTRTEAVPPSGIQIDERGLTPNDAFTPSAEHPPIVSFAWADSETSECRGGFVSGYPVLDTVREWDLKGKVCSTTLINDELEAAYNDQ